MREVKLRRKNVILLSVIVFIVVLTFIRLGFSLRSGASIIRDETSFQSLKSSLEGSRIFDLEGVMMVDYAHGIGPQYNPVNSAQFAQVLSRQFHLKGGWTDEEARESFFDQITWLVENQDKESGAWFYEFDLWDLEAPWMSAMAQGEAINALLAAYRITGDGKYLEASKAAVNPFELGVGSEGVIDYVNDLPFYEEYPNSQYDLHTLNGFIFSLFGLHKLYEVTSDPQVLEKFGSGLETLRQTLHLWEADGGSFYSLGKNRKFTYHKVHIKQLAQLYEITGDKFFMEKAVLWDLNSETDILKGKFILERIKRRFLDYYQHPFGFSDAITLFNVAKEELID